MKLDYELLKRDPLVFIEDTAAYRVGTRIRNIRIDKGLSQSSLGAMVGVTGDRIQKYENGVRKPKTELLKKIAEALEVSPMALIDPIFADEICTIYALFELERKYSVQVEMVPEGNNNVVCIKIDEQNALYNYMKEWVTLIKMTQREMEYSSSESEKQEIQKKYNKWMWTFPEGSVSEISKEEQKSRIKQKISELQNEYDKLDENSDR